MSNRLNLKPRLTLLNLLCRICGQEDKNCIPVFGESGKRQGILNKIHSCLPLFIEENDRLPKQICLACLHKLDATWELRTLCEEAQTAIVEKLNAVSSFEIEEEIVSELITKPLETIEETIKSLSEHKSTTFGSATIVLAPTSPPPPAKAPDVPSVTTAPVVADPMMGVIPTQNMMMNSAPVTYMQPTVPAPIAQPLVPDTILVKEDGYPLSRILSNPNRKQLQTQRIERRQTPLQASRRSVPAPKQIPQPRQSLPTVHRRSALREGDSGNVPPPNRSHQVCKFCNKTFPDDIIDHHVSLHLRQSFQTCLDCNKNFRSEQAMSRHRCGVGDPINLDPDDDDEPICL